MRQKYRSIFIGVFSLLLIGISAHAQIISPEEAIGFPIGADYKLARWETITGYLQSKAANAGKQLTKVDPKYTSQKCSGCDSIVKKSIAGRKFGSCGPRRARQNH